MCHTAIGPWETFIRSCCDGLASRGFVAAAPDFYDVGACVFDAETRRERRGGEENRANFGASRVLDAVRAVRASMGSTSMKYAAVGFCLGGQVVADVAQARPRATTSATRWRWRRFTACWTSARYRDAR